jgi:two-component system CheB/CheR fusion protein
MLLELDGHQVEVAYEGENGLRKAAEFRPQIVLLDIALDGIDGYELARRLRAGSQTSDAWLIAISGYGQQSHQQAALAAGFDRYMVKPVEFDALRDVLEHLPPRHQ